MEWTKEQKEAIETKNCKLLVAAGAGSGKTAVLVERIIQKVIKDKIRDKNLFPVIYHDYSTDTVESYNGEEAVSLSQPRYKVRKVKEGGRIYKALKPLLSVASEKRKVWEPKERELLTNNLSPAKKKKIGL